MMDRIGKLIEKKLRAFREELFPGRAVRPLLRRQEDRKIPPPVPPLPVGRDKGLKGKKREQRGKTGWVAPSFPLLPPETGNGNKNTPSTSHFTPSEKNSWVKVVERKKKGGKLGNGPLAAPPTSKDRPLTKERASEKDGEQE